MGYMRHHAIIVAGSIDPWVAQAHGRAHHVFDDGPGTLVSPVISGRTNGVCSFFIAPDGSKEGWSDSDECDAKRDAFIAWLRSVVYEDGSSPLDWAEVQFGDEDGVTKVTRHSDEPDDKREADRFDREQEARLWPMAEES